ncbi:MAG: hypothetical protein ACI4ME_00315, partial [Aristaeellaceae bacterium]
GIGLTETEKGSDMDGFGAPESERFQRSDFLCNRKPHFERGSRHQFARIALHRGIAGPDNRKSSEGEKSTCDVAGHMAQGL